MHLCSISAARRRLSLLLVVGLVVTLRVHGGAGTPQYNWIQAFTIRGLGPAGYVKGVLTSTDYSAQEQQTIREAYAVSYPEASLEEEATRTYNCHGWAFLKSCWLPDPRPEWAAGFPESESFYFVCSATSSFSDSCKNSIAQMGGATVTWPGSGTGIPLHSGFASSWDDTAGGVYGSSKWGTGPRYSHQFKAGKYPQMYGTNMNVYRLWFVVAP